MSDAMTAWAKAWLDRREKSKALDAAASAALKASAAEVQAWNELALPERHVAADLISPTLREQKLREIAQVHE